MCLTSASCARMTLRIAGELVVLKGSMARNQGVESWSSYLGQRQEFVQEGKLTESPNPDYLVFAENVPFASPSAAAAVVAGGNRNG
jgi:hypothetical protein